MDQTLEVYSVAAMLYCSQLKYNLEHLPDVSGITTLLDTDKGNLILSDPHDYHFTLSYIEFRKEDWSEAIPSLVITIILSLLKDTPLTLPFKRLGILYKYFFAEFDSTNLLDFKRTLLEKLQKELPHGIYGFEQEYFPHVTLGRISLPADTPRIIKRALITTHIQGQELCQPHFVQPLYIDTCCSLKIGIQLQKSNFI